MRFHTIVTFKQAYRAGNCKRPCVGETKVVGDMVLVVEDDSAVRGAIKNALEAVGYIVKSAENCSTGFALAVEEPPSLLVLDVNLPDGTGWDLLERIRVERAEDDPQVIIVSSERVSRADLRTYRADRFIPKPFDMSYLTGVVRDLLDS